MASFTMGCLIAVASMFMVFFTYQTCMTIIHTEEVLLRWATQHGFRIIRKEAVFQGPFSQNKYCPTYFITIEDEHHKQRNGWVRLGAWYIIGFRENINVHWED